MKIKKKSSEKIKLATYTAMAGAFAATTNSAEAQIIYTDVNPDSTVSLGQYPLDMNNDGTPEFFIKQTVSYGNQIVGIINNNNGQGWLGYGVYFNYASALNAGVPVGPTAIFNNPTPVTGFATMAYVTSYGSAFGQWQGATDKFLGLKFTFGGNTYYGWARVTVPMNGTSFTIKDYAYNSTPNTPINTGDMATVTPGTAPMATGVLASDVADQGNGSDLQVSFIKAVDETQIAEYRIIVIPSADTASFDLAAANAVPAANYTTIAKTGSNIQTTLSATAKDKNGNAIVNNVNYNVYVLSVADGTIATTNSLSIKSNIIKLQPVAAPVATSVAVLDIGDQGNGADLQVSFNKAMDETKVSEYRIIAVPSTDTASFDLAAANALPAANYTSVAKTGSNITTTFPANSNDKNGNPISNNVDYNIYILSVADGTLASVNSLSAKSNTITLLNKTAPAASSIVVSDIGNQGDGSDMQVAFNKAPDETGISEYRIIVVPSSDTASFDLASANSVMPANYTVVNKTGSNVITTLSATANDKNGNAIVENVDYNIYVLSIANGNPTMINGLSARSNTVTLKNTVGIDELTSVGITAYAFGKTINIYAPKAEFDDRIMIIDLGGRTIYNEEINGNSKRIVLDKAASGIYILRISKEDKFFSKKIYID